MEDRRSLVRRGADREIFEFIERKTGSAPSQLLRKRKLRRAIRHTCKVLINLDISDEGDATEESTADTRSLRGRLLDLSESGASLFSKYELKPGTEFRLRVEIYDGSTIETRAEARRSEYKQAKDGYVTGARFTQVDPKNVARIKNFLKDLEATVGM